MPRTFNSSSDPDLPISPTSPIRSSTSSPANSPRGRGLSLSPSPQPGSPRPSAPPEVRSSAALVADVQLAKSRLLVTKTHVTYPPVCELVPFQSCVLGFRIIFHPSSSNRVRDAEISMRFIPAIYDPSGLAPVIKSLYPIHSAPPSQQGGPTANDPTTVTRKNSTNLGLRLGYDPFGSLTLNHSSSLDYSYTTSSNLIASGIESSHFLLTITEDPISHTGVTPFLDFAILLYLPSLTAFEAELSIEATVGRNDVHAGLRRMLGSPRIWKMGFDGVTQLGSLKIGGVVEGEPVHRDQGQGQSRLLAGSGNDLGADAMKALGDAGRRKSDIGVGASKCEMGTALGLGVRFGGSASGLVGSVQQMQDRRTWSSVVDRAVGRGMDDMEED